jgi:hypothetical protein
MGKNIFLKNNLKSIFRYTNAKGKEKIDHSQGKTVNKYLGDWETSRCGIHAKDVSDSLCAASFQLLSAPGYPSTDYDMENERLGYKFQENGSPIVEDEVIFNRLMGIRSKKVVGK